MRAVDSSPAPRFLGPMAQSMTGFGTGSAQDELRVYTVEIRSVNHRYCDIRTHAPPELAALHGHLESVVRKRAERGRIDVSISVSYLPNATAAPRVDLARARGYQQAYDQIARELGQKPEPRLDLIVAAPGVIRPPEFTQEPEVLIKLLAPALKEALDGLLQMRAQEGKAIAEEIQARLLTIQAMVKKIESLVPLAIEEKKLRLKRRLDELMEDAAIDPLRLAQEVALLVDRSDVAEELERLASHLGQFGALMRASGLIGRKLDFLLQEMNREVNTIGSKSANTEIAYCVVELKSELERVREQIQNVA